MECTKDRTQGFLENKGCKQEVNYIYIGMWPRMDFLDLQQLDHVPNGCI